MAWFIFFGTIIFLILLLVFALCKISSACSRDEEGELDAPDEQDEE